MWGSRDLGDGSPLCASVSLTEIIRALDRAPCDFCKEASSSRPQVGLRPTCCRRGSLGALGNSFLPQPSSKQPSCQHWTCSLSSGSAWLQLQQSHCLPGHPLQIPAGQPRATAFSLRHVMTSPRSSQRPWSRCEPLDPRAWWELGAGA